MITLTYQYKLQLNQHQESEINKILDVCKTVYNYALRERKDWLSSRKSSINSCSIISEYIILAETPYPNYHVQAKNLTIAKKTNPKLKSVNAQVLQQTLKTLDPTFRTSNCITKKYMNHHQNLSQQIKQMGSIKHQKISGTSIVGKPGSSVGSRKHRSNYTPVDSINQFSQYLGSVTACGCVGLCAIAITDNIFDKKRVKTLKSSSFLL